MSFTKNQIIIVGAALVIVVGVFSLFIFGGKKTSTAPPIVLSVWGTQDKQTMADLIALYTQYRPGAVVTYTQVDPSDYEQELLTALAAGTGPDVFEIGNREVPRWESTLAPMPSSTFATEFNLGKLQTDFPSVVTSDFVQGGQIYGLPFSIDTLAMIYNRTYLDSAGIATPPATWDDLLSDIPKLRQVNAQGQITRAAVALGGTRASMSDADDILYLLMEQNGTQMTTPDESEATFSSFSDGASTEPGLAALNFYLQFSDAASPYYTWNDAMGDAEQSFVNGDTAILLDYHSTLADIQAKAPFLSVGVAAMPQPSGATVSVNYPDYQGFVAAKKGNVLDAWDFILSLADTTAGESLYLKDTNEPAAQRSAIATQEAGSDPVVAVFAQQALSAQSWYEANDTQIDSAFDTTLQNVLNGSMSAQQALSGAQDAVSSLMR